VRVRTEAAGSRSGNIDGNDDGGGGALRVRGVVGAGGVPRRRHAGELHLVVVRGAATLLDTGSATIPGDAALLPGRAARGPWTFPSPRAPTGGETTTTTEDAAGRWCRRTCWCRGGGRRPGRAHELSHLRRSVLRMTGFIEG
jgi:hypothetical protein